MAAVIGSLRVRADGGNSWELGAVGQTGTRESQVVQVPSETTDAQLYGTERNMGAKPGDLLRHERIVYTPAKIAEFADACFAVRVV